MQRVTDANSLFQKLYDIGDSLIFLLIFLAVLYIIWASVKLAMSEAGEPRKALQGQIIWGIIGLAIILSIWGLVNILGRTFGLGNYGGNNSRSSQDLNGLMLQGSQSGGIYQPANPSSPGELVPFDSNYRD